jgi:ABC-type nitrate/sulfonate/bicarbonate transport system substrate-binding protein
MKTLRIAVLLSVMLLAASLALGCAPAPEEELVPVVLSLDWVPNTNHSGFYVALDQGWYEEEGIALEIQVPADPSAAIRQVAVGHTPFGVSFQEEVTIARSNDIPVVSIAAIIQNNTSAFASLATAGLESPADFEGLTYASYGLPIERPILGSLMACYDADIDQVEFIDVGFDAFPALLGGRVDLAWIFEGWDGVQAELMGVVLAIHPLEPDCVPNYYTPVIIAGETTIQEQPELVERFLRATVRGYEHAIANPEEAAEALLRHSPESDPDLVRASQQWLSPRYQEGAPQWGVQDPAVWAEFTAWMIEHNLIDTPIDAEQAFTNEFLP